MKQMFTVLLALFLSLGASAKSSSDSKGMQDEINRKTYHELVMIPQLTIFDNLSFKVDGSTVTLLGQVRTAVIKGEAENAVKKIEGVEHVNNQIQILPPSPTDDRLRRQLARALFSDSQLFPYSLGAYPPIHIIVEEGHVALEGMVNNQSDKDVAGIRANGVPGVFSVDNDLRVAR
jgi:hyperosmotically inducible protein